MKIIFENVKEREWITESIVQSSLCPSDWGFDDLEAPDCTSHDKCRQCWDEALKDATEVQIEGKAGNNR